MAEKLKCKIGEVFNRLTVIGPAQVTGARGTQWECRCECGVVKIMAARDVKSGNSRSCGCLKLEVLLARNTIHGQSKRSGHSPEYTTWGNMIQRCKNPKDQDYHNYGGRGIRVCKRWRESFADFFRDMGKKPGPNYSIDRIDNNGDYCPENCKWETPQNQANNTRHNRYLTLNGKAQTVADWSRELRIHVQTLLWRVQAGWSDEKTLTTIPDPLITIGRVALSFGDWSRKINIPMHTLRKRLERGWSMEKTMTVPKGKQLGRPKKNRTT